MHIYIVYVDTRWMYLHTQLGVKSSLAKKLSNDRPDSVCVIDMGCACMGRLRTQAKQGQAGRHTRTHHHQQQQQCARRSEWGRLGGGGSGVNERTNERTNCSWPCVILLRCMRRSEITRYVPYVL